MRQALTAVGNTHAAQSAVATHAARDRDRTSAAATMAVATAPGTTAQPRRARNVATTIVGIPMAARCATKFRLPSVPPGDRFTIGPSHEIRIDIAEGETAR